MRIIAGSSAPFPARNSSSTETQPLGTGRLQEQVAVFRGQVEAKYRLETDHGDSASLENGAFPFQGKQRHPLE